MKKLLFLLVIVLQSCCFIPYFISHENISWTSSDSSSVFAYEFAVVNPKARITGYNLFQYVNADDKGEHTDYSGRKTIEVQYINVLW